MFHDFFAVLIRYGLYTPTNLVSPNPTSALPCYLEKSGGGIVFLNAEQAKEQNLALAYPLRPAGSFPALEENAGTRQFQQSASASEPGGRDFVDLQ